MTKSEETSTHLRVFLFDHFRIMGEGEQIRLPTRKARLLLAFLLLKPKPHAREKLAALLWGDVNDKSARASLRNALAILRRFLGHDLLISDRRTVQIQFSDRIWVDALEFRRQVEMFLAGSSAEGTAVDFQLYRGDLLTNYYDDWVLVERENLQSLYVEALLSHAQQMRSKSDYEQAIEAAELVLGTDSANERAHQHLMFCYLMLGNRDAALRQYDYCKQALQDELSVEPSPETNKLYQWIQQAPLKRMPIEAAITNLPVHPTSFIGRQREMAVVKDLLSDERLVTLTGVGGGGKTRLAIQSATDLLDVYEDGVWWVDLESLADPELVPWTICRTIGIPEVSNQKPIDTLTHFLQDRRLLLILDNCEHLIDACARLVARLLADCLHMTILATSRELLAVPGEHVYPVPSLSAPEPPYRSGLELLQEFEAIRLFSGRAAAANPDFALNEQNANPVAEICSRLEGIPLAIELAAARVRMLTPDEISDRLDDAFQVLTAGKRSALPRHRTLRASIDWSYDLLSEAEGKLFRRLSVFVGGWSLDAAEIVCSGDGLAQKEIVNLLSGLVDKSLIVMKPRGDQAHFRMLQPLNQYAREKLLELSDHGWIRDRHLAYYIETIESVEAHLGYFLSDPDRDRWLDRLQPETDNLRAALGWCLEKDREQQKTSESGLRLVAALHWFWYAQGQFSEARSWLDRLFERDDDVSARTKAMALLTGGFIACWQGDFQAGQRPFEEALLLFRRLEDGSAIAFTKHGLGFVALGHGDLDLSRSLFEEALDISQQDDDQWLVTFAMHFLGIVLSYQQDFVRAISYFEKNISLVQQAGGQNAAVAFSLFHLGRIARIQGDYSAALSHHKEGMRLFQEIDDRRGIGYSLTAFSILAAVSGDALRSARTAGAAARLQELLGPFLEIPLQIEYERELAGVRSKLDEKAFNEAWDEGKAMTLEEAIAYSMGMGD